MRTALPTRRVLRTPVRGHGFAAAPPCGRGPRAGQAARLRHEPANPADELAVGVWIEAPDGWWRIGYLDRIVAARLAPRLDAGERIDAEAAGWDAEPDGRWQRPVVRLAVPRPSVAGTGHQPPTPSALRPPGVARRTVRPVPR